jgi:hypothetical protein
VRAELCCRTRVRPRVDFLQCRHRNVLHSLRSPHPNGDGSGAIPRSVPPNRRRRQIPLLANSNRQTGRHLSVFAKLANFSAIRGRARALSTGRCSHPESSESDFARASREKVNRTYLLSRRAHILDTCVSSFGDTRPFFLVMPIPKTTN